MGCCQSRVKNRSKYLSRRKEHRSAISSTLDGPCIQSEHPVWGHYRFKLLQQLGVGASGVVFSCQDVDSSTKVALKLMHRPASLHDVEHILMELTMQAHMGARNPFIVELLEVVLTASHRVGAVMRLLDGGDVHGFIQQRLLRQLGKEGAQLLVAEEEASYMFRQLVSAVQTCHDNNLAHRDLKPANVLLDSSNPPMLRLADFSLSKAFDPGQPALGYGPAGTTAYMAPEMLSIPPGQIHETGYDLKKADAWSLGVWLHVLLLGRMPFNGLAWPVAEEANVAHLNALYQAGGSWARAKVLRQACRKLTPELVGLLDSLLQVEPERRPDIHAIWSHPWVQQPLPGKLGRAWDRLLELKCSMERYSARDYRCLARRQDEEHCWDEDDNFRCECHLDGPGTPKQRLQDMRRLLRMTHMRVKQKHMQSALDQRFARPDQLHVIAHIPRHKLPHLDSFPCLALYYPKPLGSTASVSGSSTELIGTAPSAGGGSCANSDTKVGSSIGATHGSDCEDKEQDGTQQVLAEVMAQMEDSLLRPLLGWG